MNKRNGAPPDRRRFLLLLGAVLTVGFLASTLVSFFVSRATVRDSISSSELPLISDNIYSEIQKDLIRPILVSSTMASDTFLRDWVISGEINAEHMTRYLKEIRAKYGAFTSFFVSEQTRRYYHADGILKTVAEDEPRDTWYFRVRTMSPDYEINVDPDLANADLLTIFINYRVFDYAGKYIGAAGVGLTVNAVQSLIRNYRERFARDIYFVDGEGRVVLAEAGGPVGKSLVDRVGPGRDLSNLLHGESRAYRFEVGGAMRFLDVRYIPELQWYLCVEKDETAAMTDIRRALYVNLLLCLVITVVATGATTVFVNRYQARLELVATTDSLTGFSNRQAYDILIDQAIKEATRSGAPLSVVLIDVDNFKSINDRFGHLAGDEVLRSIALLARGSIRESDIFCRWGGDEFVIVLKECRRDSAAAVADKIRERVDATGVTSGSDLLRATVSMGVAERLQGETAEALVARADRALLAAKSAGRNRVRVAERA